MEDQDYFASQQCKCLTSQLWNGLKLTIKFSKFAVIKILVTSNSSNMTKEQKVNIIHFAFLL